MAATDDEAMQIINGAIKRRFMELLYDTINHQPNEGTLDAILGDLDVLIDAKILMAFERFHLLKSIEPH